MTSAPRAHLAKLAVAGLSSLLLASECNEPALSFGLFNPLQGANPVGLSQVLTATLRNGGAVDAQLGEIRISSPGGSSALRLAGGTCSTGMTLVKSTGNCTIDVEFAPTAVGLARAVVDVAYTWPAGETTKVVSLSVEGSGLDPLSVFSATMQSLTGWDEPLGVASNETFLIVNYGGYAVTLGDITSAGLGLKPPFSLAGGTCTTGATLAPQTGECTIDVRFSPTALGEASEELAVQYRWFSGGWASATQRLSLSATGLAPLTIAGSPYFGPTPYGTGVRRTFTVTNHGGSAATLGTVSGAALGLAAPFSLAGGTCGTGGTLAALGGTCTLDVDSSATVLGTHYDAVELSYRWPGISSFLIASEPIAGVSAQPPTGDCFQTGCGSGQVCWQVTSTESGAGTCIDVPPPPASCMAPCVWDALRECLPVMGACLREGDFTQATTCDPVTGWSVEEQIYGRPVAWTYRKNGAACFAEGYGAVSNNILSYYYSAYGQAVARAWIPTDQGATPDTAVQCEPSTRYGQYSTAPFVQKGSPECAAWNATFRNLTQCRTTSAGSCP